MKMIDYKKDKIYKAKLQPEIIDIPPITFIMVDGQGPPESKNGKLTEFQEAFSIIYGLVYTIKFWDKKNKIPPNFAKFNMPPAEALWWMTNSNIFDMQKPEKWSWTLMHRVPEFVTKPYFKEVVSVAMQQKKTDIFLKARLEVLNEGTCVQILHIGPYNQEAADIALMHDYAKSQGYTLKGKHHELYFGDPRRSDPKKLKTILRHPIQ